MTREYYLAHKKEHLAKCREWAKKNPTRRKQIADNWVKRNPKKRAAAIKKYQRKNWKKHCQWAKDNPAKRKAHCWTYHLRRKYGLSERQWNAMYKKQRGICPICESRPAKAVDHDHETGKVRALLCSQCNSALGLFLESPKILRRGARYIERFS